MAPPKYKLEPLYVNGRRISTLTGTSSVSHLHAGATILSERERDIQICTAYSELLGRWLDAAGDDVVPLERDWVNGRIAPNRIFVVQRHFTFRNALGTNKGDESLAYTTFPELSDGAGELRLELVLNPDNVVPGSPGYLMRGKVSDVFACAMVLKLEPDKITAVPLFIGHQIIQGPMDFVVSATRGEVSAEHIDNFSDMKNVKDPTQKQLEALCSIPEKTVKAAIAEIIGEPDVPKDWGGERSDLFSTHVRIDGKRISSSFLLKGPAGGAKFRPMEIRDLGKRGDQIERLANDPSDMLILQHCYKVTPAVRSMLRAFCNQVGRERRYCVITGYETYRILKAYGKCAL